MDFYWETDFKDSEIGQIPRDWEVVRLGEMATFYRGLSWKKKDETDSKDGKLIISIPNIENGRINFNSKHNHYIAKIIPETKRLCIGDIIFVGSSGNIKNIGRNAIVDYLPFEYIGFASFTFKATPKNWKINNRFFYYLANSTWFRYSHFSKRASDGKYNFQLREFISKTYIPLPPLEEQKAIAEVLKSIQQAIEETDNVIKATEEFKKSMMKHLFRYGYVPVDKIDTVKLKQTEIGLIPQHWEVKKLGEIVDFRIGKTPLRNDMQSWVNGTFPWVSISDMKPFGSIKQTKEKITKYALEKYFKNRFSEAGTLLMSFKLSIGKTSILEIDAVHNEAIISIFPKNGVSKYYMMYCLPTINYFDYIDKAIKGNTLNKDKLKNILIPLPPLEEQKAIAEVLQAIDNKIQKEEKKKQALENVFKSMLHYLITGKLRIKQTSEA